MGQSRAGRLMSMVSLNDFREDALLFSAISVPDTRLRHIDDFSG